MGKSSTLELDRHEFRFHTVPLRVEGLKWERRGLGVQCHSQVSGLSDSPDVTISLVGDLGGLDTKL